MGISLASDVRKVSMTDAPVWLAHVAELVLPHTMRHEGLRLMVYPDPLHGFKTIGYGCNLEDPASKKVCYIRHSQNQPEFSVSGRRRR